MTRSQLRAAFVLAGALGFTLGCAEEKRRPPVRRAAPATTEDQPQGTPEKKAVAVSGWGSIKGRVLWRGDLPPDQKQIEWDGKKLTVCFYGFKDVTKDTEHCLASGKLPEEDPVVIDQETKGVLNVFALVKDPPAVHPNLEKTKDQVREEYVKDLAERNKGLEFPKPDLLTVQKVLREAISAGKVKVEDLEAPPMIDQVNCQYVPHALVARVGQFTIAKNAAPVTHNIDIKGSGRNNKNVAMQPNSIEVFEWTKEEDPLSIACVIHPWMKMYAMVLDHPYCVVTDREGRFELKNVPAGKVRLILRTSKYINPEAGGEDTRRPKGSSIEVVADQTKDLGDIYIDASFK